MRATARSGVFAGTNIANHAVTSKPGNPDSSSVGMSNASGERCSELTATPRSRPARACGSM